MAALQRVASVCSTDSNYACQSQNGVAASEQFPAGLRVLVVDDDNTCLTIIKRMLIRCHYQVTTSTQAKEALNLLRERKGCFDVILSDVHMPDMDGYKLLELVGLEMDLPVIMMSADGRTSAVMKGIKHGACDYLIKPIREEELKNIWQHVVRKKWHENREVEHSGSLDDNDRNKPGNDDVEYATSLNEGSEGVSRNPKKRSHAKEEDDDDEPESDDPTTSKKPRVVWSVELHEQFVNAVNHLGIDKAVPKRILELMNVPGLTRENVASHLQKFRLFLKKMSGVPQQSGTASAYSGPFDANLKLHSLGRFDIQALAASGQIPPQTLAAIHAEFLGRPTVDQPAVFQAFLEGSKYVPVEQGQGVAFGPPLPKCQSNVSKHFPQNMAPIEDFSSGYGAWPNANLGATNAQNGNLLVDILQQQHQQLQQQSIPDFNHSLNNVQPSCLVAASSTSAGFQAGNSPALMNQNRNFNGSSFIDFAASDNGLSRQVQNPTMAFGASSFCDIQGIYGLKSGEIIDQGQFGNVGFVGKRNSIPTRFAVDEYEATIPNFSLDSNGAKVKLEPNMEFVDGAKAGIPHSQQFPPMMS